MDNEFSQQTLYHVALLDSNAGNALLLKHHLQSCPDYCFEILHTSSLHELCDINRNRHVDEHFFPDVILLDPNQVQHTPSETIKSVQAVFPDTPVIIFSELYNEKLAKESGELGTYGYIAKVDMQPLRLSNAILHAVSQHQHIKKLYKQANYDVLTGLANRALIYDRTEHAIKISKRNSTSLAFFLVDLDDFKAINDIYGHDVGDVYLRTIAHRLRDSIRVSDTAARLGGDEFAILLEGLEHPELAVQVAKKILKEVSEPITIEGKKLSPSLSIGISLMQDEDDQRFSTDWLVKSADTALYQAKANGKNTYSVFTDEHDAEMLRIINLENQLVEAIENHEFFLCYQPIVHATTHELLGIETLLRWDQPGRGIISPDRFIPVLERMGKMDVVSEYVMNESIRQYAHWRNHGLENISLHINTSPAQFAEHGFCQQLEETLTTYEVSPDVINLELTESQLFNSSKYIDREFKKLHWLGVQVAIDDFGTGYSSYDYMRRFEIDQIKLDKSFIHSMFDSKIDMAIINSITRFSRDLGVSIVAEGVEQQKQLDYLVSIGVNQIQGYYTGRPMIADKFEQQFLCKTPTSAIIPPQEPARLNATH